MNDFIRRLGLILALVLVAMTGSPPAAWAQAGREVVVITMDGPLTPALKAYLQRGIDYAERVNAALVVLQLNTPGGQIDLMDDMKDEIRGSRVPVVVFVAPRGAMAASAGTVLTLAGHAAAMAPETIIGAASPVGGQGEDLSSTAQSKLKEALKATVRTLASRRGQPAVDLAEAAVDSAKAATAEEAYAAGLVDFLATDLADLLRQLNGFTVEMEGRTVQLDTTGLAVNNLSINLLETLLNILTNPNVVFLLLALGTQAILIELSTPGGWVAGFVGAVSLALAFYGMGVLSVNWFGLVFIGLAFVLFILDIKAPTHGALTTAGAGSLIAGALVLFNSPGTPAFFQVNVPLVIGTSAIFGLGFAVLLTFALRAQHRPLVLGVQTLIGQIGEVRAPDAVQVAGELWSAIADDGPLTPGEKVEVLAVKGLKVVVRRIA